MSNPARELHDIYTNWRSKAAASPSRMTKIVNPFTKSGNSQILRVASLLIRVDVILAQFERDGLNVALYRRQFPSWSAGMLATTAGWNTDLHPDHIATENVLDQIEGFANYLDGKVYELDIVEQEVTLRAVINQARDALQADVTLDDQLRHYIHRLLQEIEVALDDEAIGAGFDFAAAAQRLWVAVRAAEGASSDKASKDRWHETAHAFGANLISGMLIEGGKLLMLGTGGL